MCPGAEVVELMAVWKRNRPGESGAEFGTEFGTDCVTVTLKPLFFEYARQELNL
jgi:hypothetical protein